MNPAIEERRVYSSRSWMFVVGTELLATVLCWFGHIDGAGWITVTGILWAGWQGRSYATDKLKITALNGGAK